jgi:MinD-like ATPase involved in chromosome partitioning or flagellar assembly
VETVAFYSYKGGVGRSLLLTNAAKFLAQHGKGVVALDLDFEAPGLHYKLGVDQGPGSPTFAGGAVPYLIATAQGAASPPPLIDHMIAMVHDADARGWLWLMPSGPAPDKTYWAAFKKLGDTIRLGDPSGQGLMALLDLQARIADELKPDYLLIDARTGVTELGGLATTLLADTVVCMFVANQESFDGTLAVIEALESAPRLAGQRPIRVVSVLSRLNVPGTRVVDVLKKSIRRSSHTEVAFYVLPHENLHVSEKLGTSSPLYKAYLEIFKGLFPSATELGQNAPPRRKTKPHKNL